MTVNDKKLLVEARHTHYRDWADVMVKSEEADSEDVRLTLINISKLLRDVYLHGGRTD